MTTIIGVKKLKRKKKIHIIKNKNKKVNIIKKKFIIIVSNPFLMSYL